MSFSQRHQLTQPFKIATMRQRGYLLELAPSFQSWFICFFDDRQRFPNLSFHTLDRNARDYDWSLDLLRRVHSPANQWVALGPFQTLRQLYHYYRGTSVGMAYISDDSIYNHLAAAMANGQLEVHKVYDPHEAYRAFAAATAGGISSAAPEEPESTAKPETLRISEAAQLLPLDLQCMLCDGQPAANLPYQVVLADGSQLSGALDANGKAHHDNLKPGTVSVTFGEQSDPSVEKATRDEIAAALSKMIADEQAQTTALAATWDELSGGEKVLVSTGALFTGLWNGATSAAEFVANVHNAASPHANLMRAFKASWRAHNAQTDGWLTAFKSNWNSSTHQAYVRALGFDPTQISRDDLARAYETASLIYDDAETRALLVQFGKDLAAAQHHTEWTEMGGASLFEVVLTAILAISTGGAGAAARMGTKVSHLKKLGGLFEKMATVLRKKKLHRTADGSTGGKVEAQLDKTEGAEGFEIRVSDTSKTELNSAIHSHLPQNFHNIYSKAPDAKREIDVMADEVSTMFDGMVAKAPIKSEERSIQKINSDYGGDATRIKDLARNTIIVSPDKLNDVATELAQRGANVKTINGETDILGYSGVNSTIKTQAGIYAEIQVNTPAMIYAKESETIARSLLGDDLYNSISSKSGISGGQGHQFYEQWRVLEPDSSEAQSIAEKSRDYYDSIRRANGY